MLGALFTKVLLEDDGILSVGTEHGIRQIAKKGHDANEEVKDNVDQHLHLQTCRQAAFNL